MVRLDTNTRWIAALAFPILFTASSAPADSLVTNDGQTFIGSISKSGGGYTVKTAQGPVEIPAGDVKRILLDHAAPAAGAHTRKPVDPAEMAALLQMGSNALEANEFIDARDAFTDALSLDPLNVTAARGLGFAYLKLKRPQKAAEFLAKAAPNPPVDRSMTLAMAASLVARENNMRAIKFISEYLKTHSELDEPVVNALGIAISKQLGQREKAPLKSTLFTDGMKLYASLNDKLEAARPGKKRFGIEWGEAADVTEKFKKFNAAMAKKNDAWNALQNASNQLTIANNELQNAGVSFSPQKAQQISTAQGHVANAQKAQADAQNKYDEVCKSVADVPGPVYPDAISLDDVDLSINLTGAMASAKSNPPTPLRPALDPPVEPVAPPAAAATPQPQPQPEPKRAAAPTPVQPRPTAAKPAPAPAAQVTRYAVGFAIAPDMLVTAASVVEGSSDVEVQTSDGTFFKAEVVKTMHVEGLVLLHAKDAKLPSLSLASTATGGPLTCLGFPDVALFNPVAKQMAATGVNQSDTWAVSFTMPPRLPGGPLIKGGAVVGVELGDRDSDPAQVPAATLKSLLGLVDDAAHPNPVAQDPKQAVVMVMAIR